MRDADSTSDACQLNFQSPSDLAKIRAFVFAVAVGGGLPPDRAGLLVLAVSELATNTLEHTAGGGLIRMWREGGQIMCDVVDSGPTRLFGEMPPADAARGRGLAIVCSVVDDVSTYTAPAGTAVRLRMSA